MVIVTPSIRRIYKDLIKQVVEDLNKPVLAHLPPDKVDCPNCKYDSINKVSSGQFESGFVAPVVVFGNTINPAPFNRGRCPVCYGSGYLQKDVVRNLKALVRWNPEAASDMEYLPVGREGSAVVRIKVLRADFDIVESALFFLVDGVRCEKIRPATVRGLGTQEELVVMYLQEVEVGTDVKK